MTRKNEDDDHPEEEEKGITRRMIKESIHKNWGVGGESDDRHDHDEHWKSYSKIHQVRWPLYIYIYALYPLMNLFESCLWWPNPSMAARAVIDGPWWSESHENVKTCCNMAEQVEDAKACSTWQRRLSFSCIYVPCTWVYISLHISFIPPCHFISWTHGGLKQNQGGSWRSTALKCVEVPALILEECRFQ